jgi:hypothetical protein
VAIVGGPVCRQSVFDARLPAVVDARNNQAARAAHVTGAARASRAEPPAWAQASLEDAKETSMRTSIKGALAVLALTGLLAGCASYDYGYGYAYDQPYYGYRYDYGPHYYDYGPYTYGPGYYYGAPSVGFNLGFRDFDRRDRYDRRDYRRHDRSYRRGDNRGSYRGGDNRGNVRLQQRANTRPARADRTANPQRQRSATTARQRVPAAPPAQRTHAAGNRRAAQATMRPEQQ